MATDEGAASSEAAILRDNNGSWEVHDCSYAGRTWDNCYTKPMTILFEETVSTDIQSWSTIKSLFH